MEDTRQSVKLNKIKGLCQLEGIKTRVISRGLLKLLKEMNGDGVSDLNISKWEHIKAKDEIL